MDLSATKSFGSKHLRAVGQPPLRFKNLAFGFCRAAIAALGEATEPLKVCTLLSPEAKIAMLLQLADSL